MNSLDGQVAIVTGASRGIGAAVVRLLAARGATVIINHRASADASAALAAEIKAAGGEALVVQADVSVAEEAAALVTATLSAYGRIDILVNNAGTTRDNLIMMMKEADWDIVITTNLKSVYNCSKAVLRPMLKQRSGRIINITSVVGLSGAAGQTNYAASKAGIIGFTKSLAKEVGSRQVTVNAIAPGFVPTALTDVLPEEARKQAIAMTPLGRLGTGEDIAEAVAFFASPGASFITGQVLSVDGGLVMQ